MRSEGHAAEAAGLTRGDETTVAHAELEPVVRGSLRRAWVIRRALFAADVVGLLCAVAVTGLLTSTGPVGHWELLALPGFLFVWLLGAKAYGLYDHDEAKTHHSTIDELMVIFHWITVSVWLAFALGWATGLGPDAPAKAVVFWLAAFPAVALFRALARTLARRRRAFVQNTVVIGAGEVGHLIARKLHQRPEYGLNLVGFVDANPKVVARSDDDAPPVLGGPDALAEIVERYRVERVIVAFSGESHGRVLDLLRSLRGHEVQIDIVPRLFEMLGVNMVINSIEGIPILSAPPFRLSRSSRVLKRTVDVVLSVTAVAVLLPTLSLIALLIKLTSPGPVLFKQTRMGTDNRPFTIYKFRTMHVNADSVKASFAQLNKHRLADARMFKIPSDPRVTPLGRLLRRLSLDELPQLLNVIKGDMSLVGPRPLILEEDQFVERWARRRLDLRPGLTGPWQVLGRSDIPFEEMIKLDYLYVTGWTLGEDLKLLLKTLPAVLTGRGSY